MPGLQAVQLGFQQQVGRERDQAGQAFPVAQGRVERDYQDRSTQPSINRLERRISAASSLETRSSRNAVSKACTQVSVACDRASGLTMTAVTLFAAALIVSLTETKACSRPYHCRIGQAVPG